MNKYVDYPEHAHGRDYARPSTHPSNLGLFGRVVRCSGPIRSIDGVSDRPALNTALGDADRVLRNFLDDDGRLIGVPVKASKRLVVLNHLAQSFDVGRRYPEKDVDEILRGFYSDWAVLRRALVDEGFLDRADGVYWRSGGTVE